MLICFGAAKVAKNYGNAAFCAVGRPQPLILAG